MSHANDALDSLAQLYDQHREQIQEDYFTYLRFASVSTESAHKQDIEECYSWLEKYCADFGLTTERWETSGHPTLFAHWMGAGADKPTILLYGHYDVQPVDPIELWNSAPFEPHVEGETIFARGASDNKGQNFYAITALKQLMQRDGKLPINIKLLIEGEEEAGSAGLSGILQERAEQLKADYVAIVDLGLTAADKPAVTLGIRGMITMQVDVQGTKGDLHSGGQGGMAYNPLHALSEMIAGLRDAEGRVTVAGFYDDVQELTEDERKQIDFSFSEEEYVATYGSTPTGGEQAFSPLERQWIRPTLEINGIWGGYTGDGFKTVIPALAHAKVSCRLVPGQDPQKIADAVKRHFEESAPAGCTVTVTINEGSGPALRSSPNSSGVQAFVKAYSEVLGKECSYILTGGTIPIAADLARVAEGDIVMMGYALDDDQIHAPNEYFDFSRFRNGYLTIARTLEILGNENK